MAQLLKIYQTAERGCKRKLLNIIKLNRIQMFSIANEELIVTHNEKKKEFIIGEGAEQAKLQYENIGKLQIELWHTEVPPAFRGKGVAKILAKAAFDHVVDNDLKVLVTCTYLKKYLVENPNPEYTKRLLE